MFICANLRNLRIRIAKAVFFAKNLERIIKEAIQVCLEIVQAELEIVDIDETGRIVIPPGLCEKIGIHPHDKLILGVKNNTLLITKQKTSVFDLQKIAPLEKTEHQDIRIRCCEVLMEVSPGFDCCWLHWKHVRAPKNYVIVYIKVLRF